MSNKKISMNKTEIELRQWIESLSKEQLSKALKNCITELEMGESIRYYFDEDENEFRSPYWTSCGESIIDI